MAKLQRFIPQTPDPYLKQADQLGAVKFGHLNSLVDAINSTIYGDYLQLAGDGPMSTTLRALEDPEGNLAKLYLAIDKTAILGPLKIGDASSNVASAILQIDSTTQGVLFPRLTAVERDAIAAPAVGLLIFNTDTSQINAWNGSDWVPGGFLHLDELYDDAFQQTVGITPKAAYTNSNIAIVPNGTGAITAQVPDDTITGGQARGQYAVDLQRVRNNIGQVAKRDYSVITGGQNNWCDGDDGRWGFVGGGLSNRQRTVYGAIVGGQSNQTGDGNSGNVADFIGGGSQNIVFGSYSAIVAGRQNSSNGSYTSIGGGYQNTITNSYATVVGGYNNTSSGQYSVSGGSGNIASGISSVAMGKNNTATSNESVTFGNGNTNNGARSVVSGGINNTLNGNQTVIGGGIDNSTNGNYNVVAGGQ